VCYEAQGLLLVNLMQMTKKVFSYLAALVIILSACAPGRLSATATPAATLTPTLPGPVVNITRAPDAQGAAETFLTNWQAEDYDKIFAALTRVSQDAVKIGDFKKRYQDISANLSLQKLDYTVLSSLTNPKSAQVAYRITFHTALFGDLGREMLMNLELENGIWKVQWDETLILPELKGGNHLALDVKIPTRSDIYARSGKTKSIITQTEAVALGIVPGEIGAGHEGQLLNQLSALTGKTQQAIKALYENAGPNWYVPVGEAALADVTARYDVLSALGGLRMNNFTSRFYYD